MKRLTIHTTLLLLLACGPGDGDADGPARRVPATVPDEAAMPVAAEERAVAAHDPDPAGRAEPAGPEGQSEDVAGGADVPASAPERAPAAVDPVPGASATGAEGAEAEEAAADEPQEGGVAADVLRAAARTYEGVESLQAVFEQTLTNTLLGTTTRSRGMLYQRQPDRFLMRFAEPAGDVILSDGRHFWVYYPSVNADQVIRAPVGEKGRSGIDLRAQFVGDPVERFDAEYHGTETVRGREAHVLTLVPRRDAGYRSLKVWIDERDHLVRRFELRDHQDVVRRFELMDLAVNPTLPDSLFRFTPPPDARIIDRG